MATAGAPLENAVLASSNADQVSNQRPFTGLTRRSTSILFLAGTPRHVLPECIATAAVALQNPVPQFVLAFRTTIVVNDSLSVGLCSSMLEELIGVDVGCS